MIGYLLIGAMLITIDTLYAIISSRYSKNQVWRDFTDDVTAGRMEPPARFMYVLVIWAFAWPVLVFANIMMLVVYVAAMVTQREDLVAFSIRMLLG